MEGDTDELTRIAAEQHREITAARVFVSDLDLAFRLQLEEAMAASLAFQPSSSTSPAKSQQPPIIVSNNDAVNLPDFQTLDNFESEIRDHVFIETEKKKLKEDLNRRIHDQKLAREIFRMPEDQWQEVGNNFQRPYGEGSSSSSKTEENSEVFRVYFKGLLSEERVRSTSSSQKTMTFAGIGVAICDSRDQIIFEMRKPLDLIEDDRICRRNVEGKALVEALNAATALDLKRIVFYCDYYTLFQYVTGRWNPKQAKILAFLDQIKLLRKSFTSSTPAFVARNEVKFAFKLAREAIVSQINKPAESNHGKLENCEICSDDKSTDLFFTVDKCKHRYCFSCMKQHVEVKLLHGVMPKCPHEDCESELKVESCEMFMTPKLIDMMKQLLKEASIPVTDKVYCPYPKCSALMSKTQLLKLPRLIYEYGARTCSKCHGDFCVNCRVPWHTNMSCAEYKRRNPTPLVEESKLKNLAARNLWRQCIKCKHMIELATGCYHMTCRCGYEFCYTCGAEWKDKKATCTCPIWDEENIVDTEDEDDGNFDDEDHQDDDDDDNDYDSEQSDDYFF